MNNRTLALVSYITIIGWLISFFSYKGQKRDSLVSYHLRQSFGLFITAVIYNILVYIIVLILAYISPGLAVTVSTILGLVSIVFLILVIIGILNANNGEEKPLPIIGKIFENKFNFLP